MYFHSKCRWNQHFNHLLHIFHGKLTINRVVSNPLKNTSQLGLIIIPSIYIYRKIENSCSKPPTRSNQSEIPKNLSWSIRWVHPPPKNLGKTWGHLSSPGSSSERGSRWRSRRTPSRSAPRALQHSWRPGSLHLVINGWKMLGKIWKNAGKMLVL